MVLTLPRANITESNPFVRFVVDNGQLIREETTEVMLLRYRNGQDTNAKVLQDGKLVRAAYL
jgi:hypothetical protein